MCAGFYPSLFRIREQENQKGFQKMRLFRGQAGRAQLLRTLPRLRARWPTMRRGSAADGGCRDLTRLAAKQWALGFPGATWSAFVICFIRSTLSSVSGN